MGRLLGSFVACLKFGGFRTGVRSVSILQTKRRGTESEENALDPAFGVR
jgi:hypothetical protein